MTELTDRERALVEAAWKVIEAYSDHPLFLKGAWQLRMVLKRHYPKRGRLAIRELTAKEQE